jgi:hypothetical protein
MNSVISRLLSPKQLNVSAPPSRKAMLEQGDGEILPPGSLAALPAINYDRLISEYLGVDGPQGFAKTLKWLARYGLIANRAVCRECQMVEASLVKYDHAPEGLTVCLISDK